MYSVEGSVLSVRRIRHQLGVEVLFTDGRIFKCEPGSEVNDTIENYVPSQFTHENGFAAPVESKWVHYVRLHSDNGFSFHKIELLDSYPVSIKAIYSMYNSINPVRTEGFHV